MPKYESMHERLLANSVRADIVGDYSCFHGETFCWLWLGTRNSNGYGLCGIRMKRGPRKGKVVPQLAHRLSLKTFKNRVISGRKVVKHLCNVRTCINPDHLQGGTAFTNMRQCVREGRHWSGSKGKKPDGHGSLHTSRHARSSDRKHGVGTGRKRHRQAGVP